MPMPTPSAQSVTMRPSHPLTGELAELNDRFETSTPAEIVGWAAATFGRRLVLAASFADTLMIDIATRVDPDIEVVFLDTGYHFAETLQTVRQAMDRYALHLTVMRPAAAAADLWADGPDACCAARKVTVLDSYLAGRADAWLSGLRRADHPGRLTAPTVSIDARGLVKINPIAHLGDDEVARYVAQHDVIVNPLKDAGFASIGCWPCTEPSVERRAGRWSGTAKTECGLHR
ncbi:MAG: phosphoadenylyl-sulfate reductase [Ilumatobacter sp.]|uniref:phosphoadenylyl-sulfate reductase n=1 Tax=Ilumatobacter sp. TaxID=1967498 RepID=UPI00261C18E0|nr:phosphoadenylyl-sulfate reductase [Ilumatobacter sp.]MDJ0769763.1 phosphoadenylyl-sulfate reductase [Ilumatobacter sp.]